MKNEKCIMFLDSQYINSNPDFEIQSILESHHQTIPQLFFWSAFVFCESVSSCKNSVIFHLLESIFQSLLPDWPDWPHPLLTMPTPQIFKQLLICMNLYQHAKKPWITTAHSSYTVSFRVQRIDLLLFSINF